MRTLVDKKNLNHRNRVRFRGGFNLYEQTTLQRNKVSGETKKLKKNTRLAEFEKMHSPMFIYFLEQYEKWKELKGKTDDV